MLIKLGNIFQFATGKDVALSADLKEQKTFFGAKKREKLIVSLEDDFRFRFEQTIQSFVLSLAAAENRAMPQRYFLYDLFDQVVMDNHIAGITEHTIIDRILGEAFSIVNEDGSKDDVLTEAFKAMWFEDVTRYIIESKFWGHSLIQVVYNPVDGKPSVDVTLIPRRHVMPETGQILYSQYDQTGFDYLTDKSINQYLVEAGKPEDLGLYTKAAPLYIMKKYGLSFWVRFSEMFGMPLRVATTVSRDAKDLDRLEQAMVLMGEAAYAVLQEGEKIELKESTRADAYKVYDQLVERCNSELSKLFTGVTLTSDSGTNGSRSLGEVHERILDAVIEGYKRYVAYHYNDQVMPKLIAQGWTGLKGKRFKYNETVDLESLWIKVSGLLEYFDIEPDFIEATFGIPVKPKANLPAPDPKNPPPGKK